jgi:hypothetical protein
MGLLLAKPFFADRTLIVIDDANWNTVQQANVDFVATHPECEFLLDLFTPCDRYPTFWNGLQIFSWDRHRSTRYSAASLYTRRQQSTINGLLEVFRQEQEGRHPSRSDSGSSEQQGRLCSRRSKIGAKSVSGFLGHHSQTSSTGFMKSTIFSSCL